MCRADCVINDTAVLSVGDCGDLLPIEGAPRGHIGTSTGIGHALPDHQACQIGVRPLVVKVPSGERTTVYATGRTTRASSSPMRRAETIEETAELIEAAGGRGIAVRCDFMAAADVAALRARIETEAGGTSWWMTSGAGIPSSISRLGGDA
jgi:hypothetical protein